MKEKTRLLLAGLLASLLMAALVAWRILRRPATRASVASSTPPVDPATLRTEAAEEEAARERWIDKETDRIMKLEDEQVVEAFKSAFGRRKT